MKLYRLHFVLHGPEGEGEGRYLAELPALPGCRAWGATASEAFDNLHSVAAAFIESHKADGDPLPAEVEAALETGPTTSGEMVVAA
jgi:predicted RNase H-like HicB family nuclease